MIQFFFYSLRLIAYIYIQKIYFVFIFNKVQKKSHI